MKNITFKWICLFLGFIITLPVLAADKEIELLRNRFKNKLLAPEVDNEKIKQLIQTSQKDGTWPGIDYTDTSRIAFQHSIHLRNMVQLSHAYKKKGSDYYRNKQVKQIFDYSLDFWLQHDFLCENWWNNQIGTPNDMLSILLIMDDNLSKKQVEKILPIVGRAHLLATGARPSGDRIKIAGILAKTALFCRDKQLVEEVIKVMENEIRINMDPKSNTRTLPNAPEGMFTGGRGLEADFSFHHRPDRVNNTLSYGIGYAHAFIEWAAVLADTRFRFSEEKTKLLVDFYLDGICSQMIYGKKEDPGIQNRDITRPKTYRAAATGPLEGLLMATDYRKSEIEDLIRIRKGEDLPVRSFSRFFWMTEHFVFQRPEFYTSVRMYSTRVANMEEPYNGEGLLNHYRGDGTNYISVTGDEYDDMTPVLDWRKIPGTTVVQLDTMPGENEIQKYGLTEFVGAVTDGLYGAVAFDFKSPHNPLTAKKSWFFFDKAYVCLGSQITSTDRFPVATTLNQCRLRGDVTIETDNDKKTILSGRHKLENVHWIHHDQVGYIFPENQQIELINEKVTGSWARANRQTHISKAEVNKEVFNLWLNHGRRPRNSTYEYIILPGAGRQETESYAKNREIEILSNTAEIQAVKHTGLKIAYVIFHTSGQIAIEKDFTLSAESQGMLMIRYNNETIEEIVVSDPSHKLEKIHFSIDRPFNGRTQFAVPLPQGVYAGQSVVLKSN